MSGPDFPDFSIDGVHEWVAKASGLIASTRLRDVEANTKRRIRDAMAAKQHVWIATVAYYIDVPPVGVMVLNSEHLMAAPAIGCFLCEDSWSPELQAQPCVAVGMP
jgi:hypothetical protein